MVSTLRAKQFGHGSTYIERHKLLPVAVEGAVVEIYELLCTAGITVSPETSI